MEAAEAETSLPPAADLRFHRLLPAEAEIAEIAVDTVVDTAARTVVGIAADTASGTDLCIAARTVACTDLDTRSRAVSVARDNLPALSLADTFLQYFHLSSFPCVLSFPP